MSPAPDQIRATTRPIGRMIGADISWLPEIEAGAGRFAQGARQVREHGAPVDAITLLRRHGFNTIRLRIFVNPENPGGYSPGTGFCGLDSTLSMARRVKAAGMQLLLDFHYSDYWADPQQQNKPLAWAGLEYGALRDTVRSYTSSVLRALQDQGTAPDMVQIGNEINHGLLWPDGHVANLDQLAGLLQAGVEGTEAVAPGIPVMMHIALGGQNDEARFWLDNMIARGVRFDVIGLSYYPRWHGTLEDLSANLNDLVARYRKPVNVVEYSDFKRPVHDIVFGLPNDLGKGAAIWEPIGWRSGLFDREGRVTDLMQTYDSLSAEYLPPGGAGATAGGPTAPAGADTIPGTAWTTEDWRVFEAKVRWAAGQGLDTIPVGAAIARLGMSFVGTTYTPGTLEGPGPERLVVNLREFDCVTFVENLLALTLFVRRDGTRQLANPPAARARYESYLSDLRYRDGRLDGYPSRLHYFSEWLGDNGRRGHLQLLTRELGGVPDSEPIRFMSDHPGSYRQLADPAVLAAIRRIEADLSRTPRYYLPKDRIEAVAGRIEDGDVIAATSALPGLDVAHTGIAVWQNGELHLLHAPLVGKSVELSARPLAERIRGIATQDGIMVARVSDRR
jgi:hypothetical protein